MNCIDQPNKCGESFCHECLGKSSKYIFMMYYVYKKLLTVTHTSSRPWFLLDHGTAVVEKKR